VIKGTIVRVVFSVTHDMVDGRVAVWSKNSFALEQRRQIGYR